MKPLLICFLISTFFSLQCRADEVDQISKLTKELVKISKAFSGVGTPGQKLSDEFQKLDHTKVIDSLLPLLHHKKPGVSYLASYVILECSDGVKPKHLEALKKGWGEDGDWLPNAVRKINTAESTKFLAQKFRQQPVIQGQLDWALIGLGEKAVPYLIAHFDKADPKTEQRFFEGIRFIFSNMGEKAKGAIPHLLEIAESKDSDPLLRKEAALSIGYIGISTAPFLERLTNLESTEPKVFGTAISESIIASKTLLGAQLLANQVDNGADKYVVREIAFLGSTARPLGPKIITWLDHPDWQHRVYATAALGTIGYNKGIPDLIKLLHNKKDWRLAYVAADSLTLLKAKEAIPALTDTAKDHWFPLVRKKAQEAIDKINTNQGLKTDKRSIIDRDPIFLDRSNYTFPSEKLNQHGKTKEQPTKEHIVSVLKKQNPDLLEKFFKTRNTNGEGMISCILSHPYKNGSILGARAGEWSGSIQYVSPEGNHELLLHQNLGDIVKWNDDTYIVAGGSHMGMNAGMLYEVVEKNEKVILQPIFALPGCPQSMHVTTENKLVINSDGGLLVFINKDQFEYFSEKPKKEPEEAYLPILE